MNEMVQVAIISALAALFGGLLSGAYQHFRDWLEQPHLQIDFEDDDAYRIVVDYKKQDGTDTGDVYIRARIRNTGRRSARNALVYLTSLLEVHTGGGTTKTTFHDSKPVSWAGGSFAPRDVPPAKGVHLFVDVVRFSKSYSGWNFCVQLLLDSQKGLKDYSGTYCFELTATADNAASVTHKINVTYSGNWKNVRGVPAA